MTFISLLRLSFQSFCFLSPLIFLFQNEGFSAAKARNVIPPQSAFISLTSHEINTGLYNLDRIRTYRAHRICEELGFQAWDDTSSNDTNSFSFSKLNSTENKQTQIAVSFKVKEYLGDRPDFFISIHDYSEFTQHPARSVPYYHLNHEIFEELFCRIGPSGEPAPRKCCKKCHVCECGPRCQCQLKKKAQ